MDKKKQITELIKEDNWYDIPVENTVDKIFSILGVVRQREQLLCYKKCGKTEPYDGICLNCGSSINYDAN